MGVGLSASATTTTGKLHPSLLSAGACLWAQQAQISNIDMSQLCRAPTSADFANLPKVKSSGPAAHSVKPAAFPSTTLHSENAGNSNVDAASPNEDVASGQSETAIAAKGQYVVNAFNDLSGLLQDNTTPAGSATGVAFSSNYGQTFTDLVGLPNSDPNQRWFGDPSVVAYKPAGTTYFYIGSIYNPIGSALTGGCDIALSVGTVTGSTLALGDPVVVASNPFFGTCALLDKPFEAIDPVNKRLIFTYTNFNSQFGEIDLAVCDISSTPAAPVCLPGTAGSTYQVVDPGDASESRTGSYPAVNTATGDVYVAYEKNYATNILNGDPFTHELLAMVSASCLTGVPCAAPTPVTLGSPVKSLDSVVIAGYSRGPGNDFPRIAVNPTTSKVVVVWNEGNNHPLGDIVKVDCNFALTSCGSKLRVNSDTQDDDLSNLNGSLASFALHFLPAVSVDAQGYTNISWYDRRVGQGTTRTDVFAASIPPSGSAEDNIRVTTISTDWLATSSGISPNFGDYTDNTSDGTHFYVTWSDGRIGVPQPFVARLQN
jgi:hypothetical protein